MKSTGGVLFQVQEAILLDQQVEKIGTVKNIYTARDPPK